MLPALFRITRIFFWLALCIVLGGMVALGAVAAPAIFQTNRALHVAVPGLPESMNAANYLGGQTFGNTLVRFAPLQYVGLGIITLSLIVETFVWLQQRQLLVRLRIVLLIPLALAAVLATVAARHVRQAADAWEQGIRQTGTAPSARLELETWHHRAEQAEMIKILALTAIAALTAWGLALKPGKSPQGIISENRGARRGCGEERG